MTAFEIYGWFCAIGSAGVALPQLYRLVKARTSAGLSLLLWQLTTAVASSWVFHGSRLGAWNMVVANGIMALGAVAILVLIMRDRTMNVLQTFWLPVLLFGLLAVLDVKWGLGFSLLISASQLIGAFAQTIDLLRCSDISGVSVGYLAYGVFVNAIWFVWGVWGGDTAIQFAASSLGTLTLVNLIIWALRRTGRLKPIGGGTPEDAESEGGLVTEGLPGAGLA